MCASFHRLTVTKTMVGKVMKKKIKLKEGPTSPYAPVKEFPS
jgi:hypothetical protein